MPGLKLGDGMVIANQDAPRERLVSKVGRIPFEIPSSSRRATGYMARKAQDEGVLNLQMEITSPLPHGSKFMPSCFLITAVQYVRRRLQTLIQAQKRVLTQCQWTTIVVGETSFLSYLNPK
jgi:hypothetical protein